MSQSPVTEAYPTLAPLSSETVHFVFENRYREAIDQQPITSPQQATQVAQSVWLELEHDINEKRQKTFEVLNSVIIHSERESVTSNWLRTNLPLYAPQQGQPISAQTLLTWERQGVLRKSARNALEIHSVAELVIMRMLTNRERGWLPNTMNQVAWWWCWSQDSPTSPMVPCPYPLPTNLSPSTLLWTPWLGACWDDASWLQLQYQGCIRFAGRSEKKGQVLATIQREDLEHWDPDLTLLRTRLSISEDVGGLVKRTLTKLAVSRLPSLLLL